MKNILKESLAAGQSAQAEHPSTDSLTAFAERSLTSRQRDSVLAHLALCPNCRETVGLAAPESSLGAAIPARQSAFHLPKAMRWASVAAAIAVAVGVGLMHERSLAPRQLASAPKPIQTTAPNVASQPLPDKAETKSLARLEAPARTLTPSVLKKHQSRSLPALEASRNNELARMTNSGSAGGIVGGLAGGQANFGRAASTTDRAANAFVNKPQYTQQDQFVANGMAKSAQGAPPPAAEAGAAGQLPAFDIHGNIAQERSSTGNGQSTVSAPATQTVEVTAAEPEKQLEVAPAPKLKSSVLIGAAVGPSAAHFNSERIVFWSVSAKGQLQRTSPDGAATNIEPAPGLMVRAVAAEGIEVWAAGVQPDPSAQHWQEHPVLFHSSDAGKTWSKIEGPWRAEIVRLSLAVGHLTVVAKDGMWSTINAGRSWLRK